MNLGPHISEKGRKTLCPVQNFKISQCALYAVFLTVCFVASAKSQSIDPGRLRAFQNFFEQFWNAQVSNDAAEWGGFFGWIIRSQETEEDYILNDDIIAERQKLIKDYPKRIYQQISDPKLDFADQDHVRVRYTFAYHFTGKKVLTGRVGIILRAIWLDDQGRFFVSFYVEDVKRD